MRYFFKANEEPGFMSIDQDGNVRLTPLTSHLAGKSALEALRYLAAAARKNGTQKSLSVPMQIHQMVKGFKQSLRSYAPVFGVAGKAAAGKAGGAAASSEAVIAPVSWPALVRDLQHDGRAVRGLSMAQIRAASAAGFGVAPLAPAIRMLQGAGHLPGIAAAGKGGISPRSLRRLVGVGRVLVPRNVNAAGAVSGAGRRLLSAPAAPLVKGGLVRLGSGLPSMAPRLGRGRQLSAASMARTVRTGEERLPRAALAATDGTPTNVSMAPRAPLAAVSAGHVAAAGFQRADAVRRSEVGQAVRDYFERLSRLPPSSGTAFDPRVTPAWAGVQMPG